MLYSLLPGTTRRENFFNAELRGPGAFLPFVFLDHGN